MMDVSTNASQFGVSLADQMICAVSSISSLDELCDLACSLLIEKREWLRQNGADPEAWESEAIEAFAERSREFASAARETKRSVH